MQTSPPDGEAERLAALRACDILDTPPEAAFDRVVRLATQFLEMPLAAVSFVDDDRQWSKAAIGFPFCEMSRQHSFCAHTILEENVLVVPDATRDPRFAGNPLVTDEMQVRFYAGAVLRAPGGEAVGALCVLDNQPRTLDERQQGLLRDLADLTMDEMELRTRNRLLKEQCQSIQERRLALTETNERLRAEIARREVVEKEWGRSEQRFREMIDRASDQALLHDVEGRILDVNATTCEALGYGREELLGMEIKDLVVPPVPPRVLHAWREMPIGEVTTLQGGHRCKDGTVLPVEVRLSVLETAEGRRILGLARDVTERRKQDARLQARVRQQQVISQLGLQTLQADVAHGEEALDAVFAEALARLSETLQMDLGSVVESLPEPNLFAWRATHGWPEGRPGRIVVVEGGMRSLIGYTLLTKEPVVVEDYATEKRFRIPPMLLEEGVSSSLSVVIYTEGETPFGTLSVHSFRAKQFTDDDVSFVQAIANLLAAAISREAANQRVRKALAEAAAARRTAEQANQAKSGFLSRMSHELRTPLNAILGFGQVLAMEEARDPQEAECVRHILKAGNHLLGLINEVLDISRVETGEMYLSRSHVDVGGLLRECVGLVSRLALDRHIQFAVTPPPRHTTRWTDEQRLRQVLLNLLSNAIKYNRDGGKILVGAEPTPEGGLRIKVSDTGTGMTPEAIPRLFVPFERLGQELGDVPGTGLGLVVCQRLAEAMGGSLGVESEPGRGSTFWIELPADQEPASGTAVPVPALPAATEEATGGPAATTVLYIEDNVSNLRVVEAILAKKRPGWRFVSAGDGTKGLAAARQQPPDVMLLDLHLPGLTGDRVLTELRADPRIRHIPVLMLTADATVQTREQLLADGADECICKPFQLDHLLERLDHAVARNNGVVSAEA